jgi:hypothetical protein
MDPDLEPAVTALRSALKEAPRYMLENFCKATMDLERDVDADTFARHLVGQLQERGFTISSSA